MLEGSVQRDQNRVRVNAQLIDAETRRASLGRPVRGGHRRPVQAAGSSGGANWPTPCATNSAWPKRQGRRAQNPDAIDLAMRGWAVMWQRRCRSKDQVERSEPLFEQALKIDPDNSEALAGKAISRSSNSSYAMVPADTDYDAADPRPGSTERSRSTPAICTPIGPKRHTLQFRAARMMRFAPPTPGLRSILIRRRCSDARGIAEIVLGALRASQIRCRNRRCGSVLATPR